MRKRFALLVFTLIFEACLFKVSAQTKSIFAGDTKPNKEKSGFKFTEGPAVSADGRVFFTDQPNDKIYVWNENGQVKTFMDSCERANGTFFNKNGELVACADLHNRLVAFSPDKEMRVLVDQFEGKPLNGPNDLWIAPNGGIYFSDPYFFRTYWDPGHKAVQDSRGVFYLSPDGKLSRLLSDLKQPNGLVGTPDGKTLYVADMGDRKTWKYDIAADGTLSNKTLFAPEGSDGMTIDTDGNVYLTSRGVMVYNKNGENIAKIEVPEMPSNVCFGGKNRNILFITARTSIYTLKMNTKGVN
jgi:gluconolactonase